MIHSTHRFHGRSSLRFVYQRGRMTRSELLVLRAVHNPRVRTWRAAVVVSRKVSKSAVVRNRIRRRIFEVVRRQSGAITHGQDLVFSAYRDSLATIEQPALERLVLQLMHRAGVLTTTGSEHRQTHAIVEKKETM